MGKDGKKRWARARARRRIVGRFLLYFLGGIALFTFEPFGFDDLTDSYSERIAQFLLGPFYQSDWPEALGGPAPGAEAGESAVTVVMLDNTAQDQLDLTWPIPYPYHARAIQSILRSCPRALFVDFRFVREHEKAEIGFLDRTLESYFGPTAAIEKSKYELLADKPPGGIPPHKRSGAYKCAQQAQFIDPDDAGYFNVGRYPLFFALAEEAKTDLIGRLGAYGEALPTRFVKDGRVQDFDGGYPIAVDPDAGRLIATPAVALYRSFSSDSAAQAALPPPQGSGFEHPMFMRWRYWPNPRQAEYREIEGCAPRDGFGDPLTDPQVWGKLLELSWQALLSGVRSRAEADQAYCPPFLEIPAQLLMHPGTDPESYRADLAGRVVFYGGNLSQTPDIAFSPVHGPIPGVYVHATAFDNLMTYGPGAYPKRLPEEATRWLEILLLGVLAAFAVWRQERRDDAYVVEETSPVEADREDLLLFLEAVGITLAIMALGLAIALIWRVAPANFIGLAGVSGAIGAVQGSGLYHPVYWISGRIATGLGRLRRALTPD
jgi:hypothetical protein